MAYAIAVDFTSRTFVAARTNVTAAVESRLVAVLYRIATGRYLA
jgi:hypothetical protein